MNKTIPAYSRPQNSHLASPGELVSAKNHYLLTALYIRKSVKGHFLIQGTISLGLEGWFHREKGLAIKPENLILNPGTIGCKEKNRLPHV